MPTPRLALPTLSETQAQKAVTHNEALTALDALVMPAIINPTTTAPPGSPALGDTYLVATGATGAWVGKAGQLATWTGGGWRFAIPREGFAVWDNFNDRMLRFDGGAWVIAVWLASDSGYVGIRSEDGAYRVRAGKLASDNRIIIDLYDAAGGSAVVIRDSAAADMVKLDSDGNVDFQGEVRRNAVKLLGARDTGWTAFTGTASKGGFATGTVTLTQLAQVVKALQDALTAHGIVGT